MLDARKLLFDIHLWVALALFIPLVLIGLSGVVFAWPEVFNPLSNPPPAAQTSGALAPSAYYDAARAALDPKAQLGTLTLPAKAGDPVSVATVASRRGALAPGELRQPARMVFLEPATGQVLKVGSPGSPLFTLAHDVHGKLLIDGWGRPLVGVLGFVLLGLSLTGVYLWWPRGRFVRGFRWGRTPSKMMNLHYFTGFWLSLPLAVVSLTGIFVSFPGMTRAVAAVVAPHEAPARTPGRAAPPRLAVDQAAAAATGFAPGASLRSLSPPAAGQPAWRAELSVDGAKTLVQVNDATGAAQAAPPPPGRPGFAGLMRDLHAGKPTLWWKWLVTLTGVLPAISAFTGLYTWIRSQRRKTAAGLREAEAAA